MIRCNVCNEIFARSDNLTRHRKRRYPCGENPKSDEHSNTERSHHRSDDRRRGSFKNDDRCRGALQNEESITKKEIPEFDGSEFGGDKPLPRKTLFKMMDMLNIPEHRRERIAKDFK